MQKKVFRSAFKQYPIASPEKWHQAILDLWRNADHREERYAAVALAQVKAYQGYQSLSSLPIFEEIIVSGAWWDYVDSISSKLGELLLAYPESMLSILEDSEIQSLSEQGVLIAEKDRD